MAETGVPKIGEKVGKKEIIYNGHTYNISNWMSRHPGGNILKFYLEPGEDATMAIEQFHYRSRSKVMSLMRQFKSGVAILEDNNNNSDDKMAIINRNEDLTEDFMKLHKEIVAEGLFEPSVGHLVYRILDILLLGLVGLYFLDFVESGSWKWYFIFVKITGIFSLALSFGRCGFLGHEVCHRSLSHSKRINQIVANFSYGLGLGISPSWWSSQHNRHHAMANRIGRDVDMDTLPILAFNSKILTDENIKRQKMTGIASKTNFFISNQSILFLTVDTVLVTLLWKFYLNPRYALKKRKYMELIFMALHHCLQYYLICQHGLFSYSIGFWMSAFYMFGNFSLSHSHLPVTQGQLHWVEYALLHTQDVDTRFPWLCDWWTGYLSCQIEHHLFPQMPHHRTRKVKERVKRLAAKHEIVYQTCSYWTAVVKTYNNLRDVSKELAM